MSCRLTYSITETWAFGIASVHRRLLLSLIGQCYVQVTSPRTPFFLHQQLCITKNGNVKLWKLTDQSDYIFFKYMDMDADSIRQMVESHIAACVLTDKGNNNEED